MADKYGLGLVTDGKGIERPDEAFIGVNETDEGLTPHQPRLSLSSDLNYNYFDYSMDEPMAAAADKTRLAGLDALRGVAALSVMLFHYTYDKAGDTLHHSSTPHTAMSYGYFGVDLFFMISGFVIFMTLDHAASIRQFAVARAARLYPAFLAALAIGCAARLADGTATTADQVAANLTMMPGLFAEMPVDPSYWSLAYEVIFYLWAALFFAFVDRRHTERAAIALLALSQLRVVLPTAASGWANVAGFALLGGWAPLFIVGIMAYRIMNGAASRVAYLMIPACLFIAGRAIDDRGPPFGELAHTAILTGLFGLFWLGVTNRLPRLLLRPLLFLGAISYSLYLIHQTLGIVLIHWLEARGAGPDITIALVSALVITLAWAMRRWVEIPGQRLVKSLYRAKSTNIINSKFSWGGP